MLVKANGIGIIGVGPDPKSRGPKSIKQWFDGQIEEDWSNRIPLRNPFTDGEGGAEEAINGDA
jgi:hypothetical protein